MNHGQYQMSDRLVALVHRASGGGHPGARGAHAGGRYYLGSFRATPEAKSISRAVHFQGDEIPVTVRHSANSSANPFAPPGNIVSMATKFYLPDGRVTDLIALNIPVFFARNPEEFAEVLEVAYNHDTGKLDLQLAMPFLATHPAMAQALAALRNVPAPVSFAQTDFKALHAFRFVNASNEIVYGRYSWEPLLGITGQSLEELHRSPPNALYEELEERLRHAPVEFDLVLQIAEAGDPTDDPTAAWPEDRHRVPLGRLQLTRPTNVEEIGDPVMLHGPTRLTDGIEVSEDPVLAARRGAYDVSVAYRTGGWKGRGFLRVEAHA